MCQYSSNDGFVTPYHLAHLGSFALHGAGTIMLEAHGVTAAGRITPQDCGLYKDEQIPALTSLVSALKSFTDGLTVGKSTCHFSTYRRH
jgi:2,4-dienoyl-CoA reductase-like NADH-dependent reductase (Old Yellow Enzyme family)